MADTSASDRNPTEDASGTASGTDVAPLADTAVLLLNHGAADRPSGVETFLANIFRDRDIIQLPVGAAVQRRLGAVIARARAKKVQLLYGFMGGGSPLIPYMRAQAETLSAELGGTPVHVGLRYYPPYIEDALAAIVASGVRRVVVLPQYPQYSTTTVGSCAFELARAVENTPGADTLELVTVEPFGYDPDYIAAMAARVRAARDQFGPDVTPTLLFSAHSIPMKFVDDGDPYPGEVACQAEAIARAGGFDAWKIVFQSRSGPVRWLEPELTDAVPEFVAEGHTEFVVVPISFVQDHLETLVELDVQLADLFAETGARFVRVRTLNNHADFARMGARLVRDAVAAAEATPAAAGV